MWPILITVGVLLAVVVVLIVIVIGLYNALVQMRQRVKNSWSQVDVQLKRRYDLVPNLVETAKGYMTHERETLEAVIKARQQCIDASNVQDQAQAENFLTSTLRSLFAVTENYPDLKANQNMLALQEELTSTENRIAFARQAYNDEVMGYNTKTETVPTNIIAGMFHFEKADYFEMENPEEREAPKVSF